MQEQQGSTWRSFNTGIPAFPPQVSAGYARLNHFLLGLPEDNFNFGQVERSHVVCEYNMQLHASTNLLDGEYRAMVHCTASNNFPKCQASHQLGLTEVLNSMSLGPYFLIAVMQSSERKTFSSCRTARFTSGEALNNKICSRASPDRHVLHCRVYPHAHCARGQDFQKQGQFFRDPNWEEAP
jgi:hypothetical protein